MGGFRLVLARWDFLFFCFKNLRFTGSFKSFTSVRFALEFYDSLPREAMMSSEAAREDGLVLGPCGAVGSFCLGPILSSLDFFPPFKNRSFSMHAFDDGCDLRRGERQMSWLCPGTLSRCISLSFLISICIFLAPGSPVCQLRSFLGFLFGASKIRKLGGLEEVFACFLEGNMVGWTSLTW